MTRDGRTLGSELRGARLGFRWCDPAGCYLRVAPRPGAWMFELSDAGHLPGRGRRGDETFMEWWDLEPDGLELVGGTAALLGDGLEGFGGFRAVLVDDDGKVLPDRPWCPA